MAAFKPLLPFRGRPLVAYSIDALAPLCDEILVMAGPHGAALSRAVSGDGAARTRVFADPGAGPHVALGLAARVARGGTLLVAPADAPFLTRAVFEALLAGASSGRDATGSAVAVEGNGVNPLVAVYDRGALLAALPARSLQEVAARLRARHVATEGDLRDLDDPDAFRSAGLSD